MLKYKTVGLSAKIFFLLIFFISLYLYLFRLPFPGTDDLAYKQAGVNFFRGLGFSATGLTGYLPGIERLFLHCPPLYPFVFGLWFALFGFSLSSSLALSYIICALIAFMQFLLFRALTKKSPPGYVYGLIFFCWTLALKSTHRPDSLLLLLVLGLLLLLIKSPPALALKNRIGIIALIGFALAAFFSIGILAMVYLGIVFVSLRGFNLKTIKSLISLFVPGFIFFMLLWWLPGHLAPQLFKLQFMDFAGANLKSGNLIANLKQGLDFHFRYGFTIFYLPLLFFLISISIKGIFGEADRAKRKTLISQFSGIVAIWFFLSIISLRRYSYLEFFDTLFISVVVFQIIGRFLGDRRARAILYLCLFIAYLPFFKNTLLFPLTWNRQDGYDYNKKLILQNIPGGAKVLTPPVFWYAFDRNFQVFDSHFSGQSLYSCDYVLLTSCGSGKAGFPLIEMGNFEHTYFQQNFVKQLSTMSDQPNKLLGVPISKSRWCYRFELYRRR